MGFAVNSTAQRCVAQGFQGCERSCRLGGKAWGLGEELLGLSGGG